jgi:hypothetical protein
MLGVAQGGGVNINLGGGNDACAAQGIDIHFVRSSHKDEPEEPPGHLYSTKVLPYPKLVEATANGSEPAVNSKEDKSETVAVPEDQIGRPGYPKGTTQREAPSNPMRPTRADAGDVNDRSFIAKNESGMRTEFDQPLTERFGFNTDDRSHVFPEPRKPKRDW